MRRDYPERSEAEQAGVVAPIEELASRRAVEYPTNSTDNAPR
jgi:hypothetical protein